MLGPDENGDDSDEDDDDDDDEVGDPNPSSSISMPEDDEDELEDDEDEVVDAMEVSEDEDDEDDDDEDLILLLDHLVHQPVVPGGKAIFVALGILLAATDGVEPRRVALIELLEQLKSFNESLVVRLAKPAELGRASKITVIAIMACILDIFLIATKLFSPSAWRTRISLFHQAITKDQSIQDALKRLQSLINMDMRAIATETQATVEEIHAAIAAIKKSHGVGMSELEAMKEELDRFLERDRQRSTAANTSRLLGMLDRVASADIDAQNSNGCLDGTRVDLLRDLMLWARDSRSPRIFWLNGMAGTGKSAIARSFSRNLRSEGLLGGTFFCYRMIADQAEAKRIISTLAVSLALRDSHCTEALLAELGIESSVREWNLETQVKRLLCKPFGGIEHDDDPMPIVVVDALDECSDETVTSDLLSKLIDCVDRLPVKFFLTSRPEPHIRENLENIRPDLGDLVRLHDIEHVIVGNDISRFISHSLHNMRKKLPIATLPSWPPQADIETLSRLSGRLFVYASTALQYIQRNPVERLSRLTGAVVTAGHVMTRSLDDMYKLILSDAMNTDEYEADEIDLTCRMISVIVSLHEPLTVIAFARLLGVSATCIRGSLDRLYAVIYVPSQDDNGFLSTFHYESSLTR
ncbi:unnamed protein product [Peniophora sp. CBMAI 1063]|nr:unnamed protein product [Peniophora sp. CBMAI 1063]